MKEIIGHAQAFGLYLGGQLEAEGGKHCSSNIFKDNTALLAISRIGAQAYARRSQPPMWRCLQTSPHLVTNAQLPQLQRWIPYASVIMLTPFAEAKV